MDLDDSPDQAQYRARVRAWLDEHKHAAPAADGAGSIGDEGELALARRAWQSRLADGGLVGITWPKEYGGQGLGPIEQVIANQEIARAGVPGVLDVFGIGMLGPMLIAHGNEEQKARYLDPLLKADEVWCQLFSEPAAGTDMAAAQTRATFKDDDGWRVSGQKVWTSHAQFAAFGLLLARTNPDVPKHQGLTMFIVPMDREGITVRGLRQISGEAEFNEVFLDDVQLDADSVVGEVGGGFKIALTILMYERVTVGFGSEGFAYSPERFARAIAAKPSAARSPQVRRTLGEVAAELMAIRFTGYKALTALQRGEVPGPEAGLAKITLVNASIRGAELIADTHGPDALAEDDPTAFMVSYLPGLRTAGGSEEILRNTVGERMLGLPPEPRFDKDVPFSELRARAAGGAGPTKVREAPS